MRNRLAVLLATAVAVVGLGGVTSPASATTYTWQAGCDGVNFTWEFHEAGHLADITEVMKRCWGSGGNLVSSSLGLRFDNTDAGEFQGDRWSSTNQIILSSNSQKDVIGHISEKACVASYFPVCSPTAKLSVEVLIQSPRYDYLYGDHFKFEGTPFLCENSTCNNNDITEQPGPLWDGNEFEYKDNNRWPVP